MSTESNQIKSNQIKSNQNVYTICLLAIKVAFFYGGWAKWSHRGKNNLPLKYELKFCQKANHEEITQNSYFKQVPENFEHGYF